MSASIWTSISRYWQRGINLRRMKYNEICTQNLKCQTYKSMGVIALIHLKSWSMERHLVARSSMDHGLRRINARRDLVVSLLEAGLPRLSATKIQVVLAASATLDISKLHIWA